MGKKRREEVDENLEKYLKQPRRGFETSSAGSPPQRHIRCWARIRTGVRSISMNFSLKTSMKKSISLSWRWRSAKAADILRQDAFREEQDEAQQEVRRIMRRRSGLGTTVLTIVVALIFYALGFVPFVMTASRMQLLSESLIVSGALIF